MLSCYFRALRLGGVLTSRQATPSGLQMTPPSLPGTENPGKHSSPDFILIIIVLYHNVLIATYRTCTSKIQSLRQGLQKSKYRFQHFDYFLDAHYRLLIFSKIHT